MASFSKTTQITPREYGGFQNFRILPPKLKPQRECSYLKIYVNISVNLPYKISMSYHKGVPA